MKKPSSLKHFVSKNYLALIIIFSLFLLDGIAFSVIEIVYRDVVPGFVPLILAGVMLGLFVALLIMYIVFSEKSYHQFYEQLYEQNKDNVKVLINNHTKMHKFDDDNIIEFQEMNEIYKDVSRKFKGKTIITSEADYSSVPLTYLDKENNIVTAESLTKCITELVDTTESFRNALIDFSYDLGDEVIDQEEAYKVIGQMKVFLNYNNLLVGVKEDHLGFLVYIPCFDNIAQINEELEDLLRHISLVKKTSLGKRVASPKVSFVAYPYSNAKELLTDLNIAKRGDKAINIFLPKRETKRNDKMLLSSRNINHIGKIYENIALLNPDLNNVSSSVNEMKKVLAEIANYYGFDNAGIINYNNVNKSYTCIYNYAPNGVNLINENKKVSNKFIDAMYMIKENDNSYYFANKKHLNNSVASFIDSNDISSGLFYVMHKDNQCLGLIYFINQEDDLYLDAYLKSSLISFANKIGSFLMSIEDRERSLINEKKFDDLLKLSNNLLYSINPLDYSLIYVSDALKDILGDVTLDIPCYKALYHSDIPCKDCPLKNKKNMVSLLAKRKLETSIVLRNKNDKATHLLLTPVDKKIKTKDRYDQDFLVNTYYSYLDNLEKAFVTNPGEVVYLNIDNANKIIKKFGNDGYIKAIRKLFDLMEEQLDYKFNVYLYKNDNFAIILPTTNRDEIIAFEEAMYEVSKKITVSGKVSSLSITYFDFPFPEKYQTTQEFLNHAEKVMSGYRRGKREDFVYFDNDKFLRSASHELYMLANIEESFKQNKFKIQFQPVVANKDRYIHSMELLLRVNDPNNDKPLNVAEVIDIAFKNHRIDLISNALADCINNLYATYSYTFFKSVGLDHLSINADYTYFKDGGFAEKLIALSIKNNVPKDFLMLELGEDELNAHYAQFKEWANNLPAELVCDRYEGKLLTIEQLHELGVSQIKVSRNIVSKVSSDIDALGKARKILNEANKYGITVTYVGVETRQETNLLHDDVIDFYFQGHYFFKPMDETDAFKALREDKMKEVADLNS